MGHCASRRRSQAGNLRQAALREIKAALEALPVKRLAWNAFQDEGGDVCPLGALAQQRGIDLELFMADVEPVETANELLGITPTLASIVMEENDESGATPEQRYRFMLAWIEGKLL